MALHAHPDDEALLCGGTLAMLSATGHQVILVVATAGAAGLTGASSSGALAERRMAEVERSAAALGCAKVIHLGYPDSGWTEGGRGAIPAGSFADLDLAVPAARVAEILRAEQADVLVSYDRNGGYGHPDHVRVHEVGVAAAAIAGTRRLMLVTIDRTQLARGLRLLRLARLVPEGTATDSATRWFSSRAEISHRISVQAYAQQKRAALACHRSQTEGGRGIRTVTLLLRLPGPIFRFVCGTEWFVEYGATVTDAPLTDFFASAVVREGAST